MLNRVSPERDNVRAGLLAGKTVKDVVAATGMSKHYVYAQAQDLRRDNPEFVLTPDKSGAALDRQRDLILEQLAEGRKSQRAIALECGVSVQTVNRYAQQAKDGSERDAARRLGDPLANAKLKNAILAAQHRQFHAPEAGHGFQLSGCDGLAGKALSDLAWGDCRWPVNAPKKGEAHLFCGGAALDGKAYCAAHQAIACVSADENARQHKRIAATLVGAARRNGEKVSGGGKGMKWSGRDEVRA